MNRPVYFVLLLSATAGAFLAGTCYNHRTAARNGHTGGRKVLYYTDPMHPAYHADQPGTAPDCGMQLEPVYADGGPAGAAEDDGSALPAAAMKLSAETQQRAGVQVSRVEKGSGTRTLRLFGRVAPDEARMYKLNAGIDGYIQEVSAVTTGSQVKKDQLLATFSAPSSLMMIQTYLLNLGAEDRLRKSAAEGSLEAQSLPAADANIQQRIQQLQNLGMSVLQIQEIKRTRRIPNTIKILAPVDGIVLARNVSPGQKFDRGAEWYRIADLGRVWILADAFSQDAKYIQPGQSARIVLPAEGQVFSGRVSEVLPEFDANSRSLKVRLEMQNPGYRLRPDMFVDVELPISLPPAISVPADAVLDSGLNKTVFVDHGAGVFEPRPVETGWSFGGRVQIVKGLEQGERIATSGNFLLDSESRMTQASARVRQSRQAKDPACGMALDSGTARHMSEYSAKRYYFCSSQCKREFDKDPQHYLNKAAGGNPAQRARL